MKLYVMRHGETNWNKERKIQGMTDIELNEVGIKQAKDASKCVKEYNFDLIISSPLKRAAKTAQIVAGDVPVFYSDEITERNFGKFEGWLLENVDLNKYYNCELNLSENSVEPVNDLIKRTYAFLDKIRVTYSDKKILLVTHGGVLRAVKAYFDTSENKVLAGTLTKNCEIKEFEYN